MEQLKQRMATVGAGLADVVTLPCFVTDTALRDLADEQFVELWPAPRPAPRGSSATVSDECSATVSDERAASPVVPVHQVA